ncbi:MAG: fibronectin type III domain-containing protein [Candidatus Margulisiibacteriota bacterium]
MEKLFIKFVFLIIFSGAAYGQAITFSSRTVTALKDTSVVIQYDTDTAATGQIEYGLDTNYGSLTEVVGLSYWHPLEVTGLAPGTTYHYRIKAKDYKSRETISGDFTFTTRTTAELEAVIRAARINGDLPKTYYVKNGGSNANNGLSLETAWATPYYAAQRAEAGDTIYVVDGNYSGYVGFGFYVDPVHHGIPEAPILMKAYSGNPHIIDGINIRANYITIDGFVVRDISGHGIDVRYTNGIKILNCEVYNSIGSDGICLRDSMYIIIENFYVHDTGWNGVGIKPTTKYPFSGHHFILRNGRVIDTWYHNSFDVQGDYMTVENCFTDNIPANKPADAAIGAPYRISAYHSVFNNCSGQHGNNGIKTAMTSREILITNCTFPDFGFNSNTSAGPWSPMILYNNYIRYGYCGMYLYIDTGNNLIEENDVHSSEIWGYTYGFQGTGNVTIRNEKNSPYRVRSLEGATITVEYTDGRVFSVSGTSSPSWYPSGSSYSFNSGTTLFTIYPMSAVPTSSTATVTVTKFETTLSMGNVLVDFTADTTNGNNVDFVIGDLKADTSYQVTRAGTNYQVVKSNANKCIKFSNSEWSTKNFTIQETDAPADIITPPEINIGNPPALVTTAPTAPQNLAASAHGAEITLSWQAPASDGGSPITGYRIYRGNSSGSETFLAPTGAVLSYTDTTVSKDVTYYYQVSAVNSNGEGAKSNECNFKIAGESSSTSDSGKIKVYPNPYVKGKSSSEKIVFDNLAKESTIKIYTMSGELVREVNGNGGKAEWDVSSIHCGIYLFVVYSLEGVKKGKVSIIK